MKEQYVGDINDYRKYALLRALSAKGQVRVGVCWMLTPPDGRPDGNKLSYLRQPQRYRLHDPELFDILVGAGAEPDRRRLSAIEESGVIRNAHYFNAILSDTAIERARFISECRREFADTDLVFFDPDNGIEIASLPKGRKNSSKYVYLDEIGTFYATGKSVLVYQHFPRIEREQFIASCAHGLRSVAHDAHIWAYRTKHVVFLALINPAAGPATEAAARHAASAWHPDFIWGKRLSAP
ncbi:MAG: hypothetical protein J0H01_14130 [Rhizobiales bacterium]|nr:hypothetical protein [Hyphomicrobiales bacterium]